MSRKQYNICIPGTNDVVIGPVDPENVYVTIYPEVKNQRKIDKLEIGEHVEAIYRACGQKATYWIVRVEDAS